MKELDKDALLEEAKRRYPVGTKFKSTYRGDWASVIDLDFEWVEQYKAIQNSNGGWVYQLGNWSEIVEEPKVETKFEVGKWYHIKAYNQEIDYYIKCDNTSGTHASEFISGMFRENPAFSSGAGAFTHVKLIRELSLQEIQQYLPENHPDKIKQEVKEEVKSIEEWSVGSYAVALQNGVNWKGIEKGDIYLITLNGSANNLTKHSNGLSFSCPRNPKKFKWFPTLQEAQKFSDELLGKSKTGLGVEDLIEGEFYRHNENGNIFKWAKNKQFYLGDSQTSFEYADGCWEGPFSLANASEVKWLKTCILADKFIEKKSALEINLLIENLENLID